MTDVLYWDIDGTLLSTSRAGVPALEDGVEAVLGVRPHLTDMHTAGLTDRMIVRQIVVEMGHPPDDEVERRILTSYAEALPGRLAERRGSVLPGVQAVLEALTELDVLSVLLTGNIAAGARAKLASYGLSRYFSTGGFADDGFDRPTIARAAIDRAQAQAGAAARSGVLIGDTPLDVACGAEVGLRVLAVATGGYDVDTLRQSGAWWVLPQLPDAAALLARMRETLVSPGPHDADVRAGTT